MDAMNLKGIAWVGTIYQKFEAMCLEVEETMSQETAKYVENQVQTVGASMKRFCSDVMQDLLPPSSKDLSKVASADLLLNPYLEFGIYKKPGSSIKEEAMDPVCIKGSSEDNSNSSNDSWVDWSAASFDWEVSDKDEANCDRMAIRTSNKAIEGESRGENEGKTCDLTLLTKFRAKNGKGSRSISSSNIIRTELADTCESSGLVSHMGLEASSNASIGQSIDGDVPLADSSENSGLVSISQTDSNISANTLCDQSGEEGFVSHIGSSGDLKDIMMQSAEPIAHESESEFEVTCVLVEGNDYRPANHKEQIRQSYKKKIQRAFCLKQKSARKHEYKQLAAAQSTNVNDEPKKVPLTHDLLESEWELL